MNYFEVDALNYSTLSQLDSNNPGAVFSEREEKKVTQAMGKGSLVDCLLTSPTEFNEKYVIGEDTLLNDTIKELIDNLIGLNFEYTNSGLLFVARQAGYGGTNWSDEVILKRVKTDESLKYYNEKKLNLNIDKIRIPQILYDQANNVVNVLKTHPYSSWIFTPTENVEVLFQVPIYWIEKGIHCKALLDIVYIDHNNKKIIPIDLKIKSESKYSFVKSFIRYKYYLQVVWYSRAIVVEFMKNYEGYQLEDFRFLVTSFEYPDPPLIYECNSTVYELGMRGGYIDGKKVKGVIELFDDFIWYTNTKEYRYPRNVYENNGVINLDLSIKLNE